jgi:selenoprotein W-related protein
LAAKILTQYKQKIQSLTLVPSGGGCFELTLNGELAYSKLAVGSFPDEQEMIKLVGKRLK